MCKEGKALSTGRRHVMQIMGSALALALVRPAWGASGQALSQIDLINLGMRQRILVQRMTKLYAQILMGARASDAKRLIQESIDKLDGLHTTHSAAVMGSAASTYQVTSTMEKVDKAWARFRGEMNKAPSDKQLPEVCAQCEALSSLINQSVGASAMFLSGSPIGQLVDRSGRQCYLSQRMAKSYFLRGLNLKTEDASHDIADARKEFVENTDFLSKAPENTTEIKFLLQLQGTQWPYFDDAVGQARRNSTEQDYNVATTAENMLEVLDRINLLYFKLTHA